MQTQREKGTVKMMSYLDADAQEKGTVKMTSYLDADAEGEGDGEDAEFP